MDGRLVGLMAKEGRDWSSPHLVPWLELEPMSTRCPWKGKIGWPQVLKYSRPHLSQSADSGVTLGFPHESAGGRWKQCSILFGSHWLSLQAVGPLVFRTGVVRYLEMPLQITFSSPKDSGDFQEWPGFLFLLPAAGGELVVGLDFLGGVGGGFKYTFGFFNSIHKNLVFH